MAQGIRFREQGTATYTANTVANPPIRLGLGHIYRELYLTLAGAPTLTAANNTSAKAKRGCEWACVKKIEVIANGSEVIRSFSGNQLWWLNHFFFNSIPPVTPTFGDTTTANPAFNSTLCIPFWMPQAVNPLDTMLDSRLLSDLKVDITWGASTDINADATAFTTAPTVTVSSYECFPVAKSDPSGPFTGTQIYNQNYAITGATSKYTVDLSVNGGAYRGFLINTATTDNSADLATCLNRLKLYSGTTIFRDYNVTLLRQLPRLKTGLQSAFTSVAGAAGHYNQIQPSNNSNRDAWYWLDLTAGGPNAYLTEVADTMGLSEMRMDFDVSAATSLTIIPVQLFRPAK